MFPEPDFSVVQFNILPAEVFCYFLRHTACASVNALNLLSPSSRGGSCEVGTGTISGRALSKYACGLCRPLSY